MEDACCFDLSFGVGKKYDKEKRKLLGFTKENSPAMFGVFDGHAGAYCSRFVSKHFAKYGRVFTCIDI